MDQQLQQCFMDQELQQELMFYVKLAGVVAVPVIGVVITWAYKCWSILNDIKGFMSRVTKTLVELTNEVRDTPSTQIIADNTNAMSDVSRAVRELTHFMKWSIEQTTGTKPPPFVGGLGS